MDTGTVKHPRVGVSLLVLREIGGRQHLLLSWRKNSHGDGEHGTPGGHLGFGEEPGDCALRELKEECGDGLAVTRPCPLCVTSLTAYLPDKHYLDVGMVSYWISGEAGVMEPDKSGEWRWYPLDALPVPLFASVWNLVTASQGGETFFI